MAKATVIGFDVFLADLRKLDVETRSIFRGALGEGAKVAAEKVRDALEGLPIRPEKMTGPLHETRLYGVTEREYIQILDNFGIARFRDSGGAYNTSIGFRGYVNTPSARFGDKVPTGLLVQAVEYGTEFRRPVHMLNKAAKASEAEIRAAMQRYIDEHINKIMN